MLSIILRDLFWLGAVTIKVKYKDGLEINYIGWLDTLVKKWGDGDE